MVSDQWQRLNKPDFVDNETANNKNSTDKNGKIF